MQHNDQSVNKLEEKHLQTKRVELYQTASRLNRLIKSKLILSTNVIPPSLSGKVLKQIRSETGSMQTATHRRAQKRGNAA